MEFDDIPLLTYESEIFAECGSWKNYYELEDSLTLEELMELYNITVERQMRLVRVVAGALGAELNEGPSSSSDSYNGKFAPNADVIIDEYDLQKLPFGLGYETIV